MTIVGIETSTDVCSVGIVSKDMSTERSIRERRIHSEKLLVLLGDVLRDAGLSWADVEGLALSSGPGSFTGLRIGASAAKGLLAGGEKKFALVPTFDGILRAASDKDGNQRNMMISLDAKQDEWYVQKAVTGVPNGPVRIISTEEMLAGSSDHHVLTDRTDVFGEGDSVADLRQWCRGDTIAQLGREKLMRGESDDVRTFEPAYWKDFVIRTVPKAVASRKGT